MSAASTAVLWSGGKDCFCALLLAAGAEMLRGEVVLVTFAPPGGSFRCHPLGVLERQAAGLGLEWELVAVDRAAWRESYAAAFAELARRGVRRIVTGDLVLEDWLAEQAAASGLELALPLRALESRADVLGVLARRGVEATVSGVRSDLQRGGELLGRPLSRALLDSVALTDDPAFDVCGENGEYHTVVTAFGGQRFYGGDPAVLTRSERDGVWALDFEPRWLRARGAAATAA